MLFHPDFSLRSGFFFPYGSYSLKLINAPLTGLKGIGPVGSTHYNKDDILSYTYFTDTMYNTYFFSALVYCIPVEG